MTRPNPKIELGAVDSNCAIILCDTFAPDMPIVYCSEGFELLTGYTKEETVGRNCRFLQSPDGVSERRRSKNAVPVVVDAADDHVQNQSDPRADGSYGEKAEQSNGELWQLKNLLGRREEAQVTLTNYKKGGRPFTNLITAIPIDWADEQNDKKMGLRYIVGFLVDRDAAPYCKDSPQG